MAFNDKIPQEMGGGNKVYDLIQKPQGLVCIKAIRHGIGENLNACI